MQAVNYIWTLATFTSCKPRCLGANLMSLTDVLLSTRVALFTQWVCNCLTEPVLSRTEIKINNFTNCLLHVDNLCNLITYLYKQIHQSPLQRWKQWVSVGHFQTNWCIKFTLGCNYVYWTSLYWCYISEVQVKTCWKNSHLILNHMCVPLNRHITIISSWPESHPKHHIQITKFQATLFKSFSYY